MKFEPDVLRAGQKMAGDHLVRFVRDPEHAGQVVGDSHPLGLIADDVCDRPLYQRRDGRDGRNAQAHTR